jgi:peptidoglycan/LPS O-acetylase OafA/YrhL
MIAVAKFAPALHSQAWYQYGLRPLEFGLVGSLLILGMVTLERQGWRPQWRTALLLGDISYPLFLVHVPVAAVIASLLVAIGLGGPLGVSIAWIAALCGSLAVAVVLHRTIEKPLVKASRRWTDRLLFADSNAHSATA